MSHGKHDRFWVVIGTSIAMFALLMFTVSGLEKDRDNDDRDGLLCVLLELEQHRVNSYDAHRDQATANGQPYNVPFDAPQLRTEDFSACERFLRQ